MWNDGRRFSGRVALGFGREGASVVLGYRSSRDSAESVASEIAAVGGSASVVQLDVTDQTSVDAFVAEADATYGRIDVLVNAAGRLDEADTVRFEEMSADAATALLLVDLKGAHRGGEGDEPLKRFGHPREIAETVLFLASDGAGYVNGQVLHAEGGWVPAG